MLLCVLGCGELPHIRVGDGPITMPCTTLRQLVHHLSYFSFPSTFTLYFCPVTQLLPVALPLGHKRCSATSWGGKQGKCPGRGRKGCVILSGKQADGQADCNLFLLSLAFFQVIHPSAPPPSDAVCLIWAPSH